MRRLVASLAALVLLVTGGLALAQAYRLKPGDTVAVNVWQDSKLDRQLVVAPDGNITMPLAGHIRAAGQTLQAVEAEIRKRLQANYNTNLDVTVALQGSQTAKESSPGSVFITGEVNKPGAYAIGPEARNALQVIALSGGFSPFAATSRIQIVRTIRGQPVQFVFNYDDFMSGRDPSGNINLRAGDVVVVPEKGLFGF